MKFFKGLGDAIHGTASDQWLDIITAGRFDEQLAVAPGIRLENDGIHGENSQATSGVISNGSLIRVPEETAAIIFDQAGISKVITTPGEYEFEDGEVSLFAGDSLGEVLSSVTERLRFGGQAVENYQVLFVNLRELRGIKFGTNGAIMYHDSFYKVDLQLVVRGSYAIKITNPELFVRQYLPANKIRYSFDDLDARAQITGEFLQSLTNAIGKLSATYRIAMLAAQTETIVTNILQDANNAGSWESRFGFKLVNVGILALELTAESAALVQQFGADRLHLAAYEDVSQHAANVAAQQNVAEGIKQHGFGDIGGMVYGINFTNGLNPNNAQTTGNGMSLDEQIKTVAKLKELCDAGVLTQTEFDAKKREVLGL